MTTRTFTIDRAEAWVAGLLGRAGASEVNAASVARALVGAEVAGLIDHGLARVPGYLAMVRSGKVDGRAVPRVQRAAPGVLTIDAADGFAHPALDLAIARLPPVARAQGVALAAVTRSGHCGAAGLYAEKLAASGLVALLVANGPAQMAAVGGVRPLFGANPIAFAAPRGDHPPLVVDVALAEPAADGEAPRPIGGARGAALALMVDVLAAALVGARLGHEATSFEDTTGAPPGTGQLVVAIDPERFGHDRFAEQMAALAAAVEAEPPARLPGARRAALRAAAGRKGLAVDEGTIAACEAAAA